MAEKEIQVLDFINHPKPFDAYKQVDIDAIESSLQNDALTPMERRKLEKIYQNCLFLQARSFDEKTQFMNEDVRKRLRERRIEEMKIEKQKSLHFKKMIIRAGMIALLATGTGVGFKLYYDKEIKPIKILNSYDKTYTSIEIKSGDTLSAIAEAIYNTYPMEVKVNLTLEKLKEEIININHIDDADEIIAGQKLIIPNKYLPKEEKETKKLY